MQLSHASPREVYVKQIGVVEASLKEAAGRTINRQFLAEVQHQVDVLANKYQHNKELGSARYKLYELQALIYYFEGNDESARDFIDQAIVVRGGEYARATKLQKKLSSKSALAVLGNSSEKVQLGGWLLFYIITLYFPGLLYMLGVVGGGIAMLFILRDSPAVLLSIPLIGSTVLYVPNLVYTHQCKRKAIMTNTILLSLLLVATISIFVTSIIFGRFGYSGILLMSVWLAIWLIYFSKSKRVQMTFVR